ncbi:MAG: cell division ATP-binding protein FtsE [Clostridia bacterium]|nr:cell division ATP-binding protein FtsE [Clostridia bacterium]
MIEFCNVEKQYSTGVLALYDINLKIKDGEFVFIVGASGAGKSTLIKLLMCEEHPTSGKIVIDGIDLSQLRHKDIPIYRRQLGIVFQDFRLLPNKTVFENVAFAMRVTGKSNKEIRQKVPKLLNMVDLAHRAKNYPNQLSGGEMQRVALARALANNPKVIIADEPTGNIDPSLSHEIMSLLAGISKRGNITVIVVTHEKELVDKFNKRVVYISDGTVAADHEGGYSDAQ